MSADWTPDTFLPLIGTEFTLSFTDPSFTDPSFTEPALTVPLTLSTVEEGRHSPGAPRPRPFALMFTGPTGLPQGLYDLRHAEGMFAIFLVAIQPGADGVGRYEAVFN